MIKLIAFTTNVNNVSLPNKFDYPYNYTPHLLAKTAANELQEYLINQSDFIHDFGLKNSTGIGKMFGVLVVKDSYGKLGYLAAFSGKIANSNQQHHFVPPVYNILDKNGFYLRTENQLNKINEQITTLENSSAYLKLKEEYFNETTINNKLLFDEQSKIKKRRKLRKEQNKTNNQQNINEEFYLREYEVYLAAKNQSLKEDYLSYQKQIDSLKQQRKEISAEVQLNIFEHFEFLNKNNETQNLLAIFNNTEQNIPAGAGECCAPKLLQYAFKNQLTPICMAEFWWGKPLNTSVRKHKSFYAACTGKCKPILSHMLKGIFLNSNPILTQLDEKKEIEIIFEDNSLIIINKPNDLLTVAGKEINDSVYSRIKKSHPNTTGPLIVHRLDMSTSGVLIIAKNEIAYKNIQSQFINRTIKKRYVAVLDGVLKKNSGEIKLPLRVDLNDRPKQLVCDTHGKTAITKWETIEVKDNKTKVYFYPITGRTHQLRVHAAHNLGLNTAILGDDLYGTKANRLHLHAESITFKHPITNKTVTFKAPTPF